MNSVVFICLVLFNSFPQNFAQKLSFPKQFKRCQKNDPNLDDCVRDAIQKAIPYLIKGMPKYGINPVDPLVTKSIALYQEIGPIPLNASFHEIVSKGNGKSIIKSAHVDVDNYLISVSIYTKKIILNGDYHLHAKLFRFPLEGNGSYEIILNDVTTNVTLRGAPQNRDNAIFMKIIESPVAMNVNDIKFNFKNLQNTDGKFGQNINWLINQFSKRIFKETLPLIEETQSKLARQLAEGFFKRVPYSEFYI